MIRHPPDPTEPPAPLTEFELGDAMARAATDAGADATTAIRETAGDALVRDSPATITEIQGARRPEPPTAPPPGLPKKPEEPPHERDENQNGAGAEQEPANGHELHPGHTLRRQMLRPLPTRQRLRLDSETLQGLRIPETVNEPDPKPDRNKNRTRQDLSKHRDLPIPRTLTHGGADPELVDAITAEIRETTDIDARGDADHTTTRLPVALEEWLAIGVEVSINTTGPWTGNRDT
ncbi:MAG: hypothetical protein OXI15_02055 [Chromatiales bacterium]|nr:hypothetical protein [Chromatiales bacterium]